MTAKQRRLGGVLRPAHRPLVAAAVAAADEGRGVLAGGQLVKARHLHADAPVVEHRGQRGHRSAGRAVTVSMRSPSASVARKLRACAPSRVAGRCSVVARPVAEPKRSPTRAVPGSEIAPRHGLRVVAQAHGQRRAEPRGRFGLMR